MTSRNANRSVEQLLENLEPRQLLSDDPLQIGAGQHHADYTPPSIVLEDSPTIRYAGMTARANARIDGSARADGALTVAFENLADRPTLLTSDDGGASWQATDVLSRVGLRNAQTELVTWTDARTGLTRGAVVSDFALHVLTRDPQGAWSAVNANDISNTPESQTPLASLTAFIGPNGEANVAGINRLGEVVLYTQQFDPDPNAQTPEWRFLNISQNLTSRGFEAPSLVSDITTYVTSWGQTTLAGLDASGDIQTFWKPRLGLDWNTSNLSAITGAPRFVGAITPFLTSWGGINIAGMTTEGSLEAVWWIPRFAGDWQTVNLSESFDGPALDPNSVSSFVTSWGALNVVGVRADSAPGNGDLTAYWWAPGLTNWNVDSLTSQPGVTDNFGATVQATVTPQGQFNLVGPNADGELIRYSWLPGSAWTSQNISSMAIPGHASEIVTLDSDIDRVLVNSATEVFFSAYVPFATLDTQVIFYDEEGDDAPALELFDNGDATIGDLVAGDGIFAACYVWNAPAARERIFEASLSTLPDRRATDTVTSIDAPTQARLDQITDQNTDFQRKLSQATGGVLDLAAIAQEVEEAPGVLPDSVRVGEEGLTWQTVEGILGVALLNEADYQGQRGGGPDAVDPSGATSIPANTTGNDALALGPYFYQFENGGGDETDDITGILQDAGLGVTSKLGASASDTNITLDDFKSLGGYDVVSIVSHGAAFPEYGVIVDTGVDIDEQAIQDNLADLISGRLAWAGSEDNGTFAITPDFVRRYAGDMTGAVVYIGACKSAFDRSMADAFLAAGAEAYIGYTDIVSSSFASERGVRVFETLAAGGLASEIEGVNIDTEAAPDPDPATFALFGQPQATLPGMEPDTGDPAAPPFDVPTGDSFFLFSAPIEQADLQATGIRAAVNEAITVAFVFDTDTPDQNPSDTAVGSYAGISIAYVALGDSVFTGNVSSLVPSGHRVELPNGSTTTTSYSLRIELNENIEGVGDVRIVASVDLEAEGLQFPSDELPLTFDVANFADGVRAIDVSIFTPELVTLGNASGEIEFFAGSNGTSGNPSGGDGGGTMQPTTAAYGFGGFASFVDDPQGVLNGFNSGDVLGIGIGLDTANTSTEFTDGFETFFLTDTGVTLAFGDDENAFSLTNGLFNDAGIIEFNNNDPDTGGTTLFMDFIYSAELDGYGTVDIVVQLAFESSTANLFTPGEIPTTINPGLFDLTRELYVDIVDGSSGVFLATVEVDLSGG